MISADEAYKGGTEIQMDLEKTASRKHSDFLFASYLTFIAMGIKNCMLASEKTFMISLSIFLQRYIY